MLNWRYLTTVPDFIARDACLYGPDLYVGGTWGLADNLAARAEYAPLVRLAPDGSAEAALPWASTWAAGANEVTAHYIDSVALWNDRLWASGTNGTGKLLSWDGDLWATQEEVVYEDLTPWTEGLFMRSLGSTTAHIYSFDGLEKQTVATGQFGSLQFLPDGRLAAYGTVQATGPSSAATGNLHYWLRAAGEWQRQSETVPTVGIYTPTDILHWWRGAMWWATPIASDLTGGSVLRTENASGWANVAYISAYGVPHIAEARNRLVAYTNPGWLSFSILGLTAEQQYEHLHAVAEASTILEYDGRTATTYRLDGVAPYLIVPLADGSAVAFCRSAAHTQYLRDATFAQFRTSIAGPGAQSARTLYTQPDMDTLVYVLDPVIPHPPEVPYGDLYGNVTGAGSALEDADVQTGLLHDLTDAAGDYGIDSLAIGQHHVAAAKAGYLPEDAEAAITSGGSTEQNFALSSLPPGKAAVWGHVLDGTDGSGLYGATVSVGDTDVTTSAGGFYVLEVDPGTYAVTCVLAGYTDGDGGTVTLASGGLAEVDLRVYPDEDHRGVLEGTVRDLATGAALPGAVVAVVAEYETVTDGAGAYCRRGLPLGEAAVVVTATGYQIGGGTVVVTERTRADWALVAVGTDTGSLRVTVTDEDTALPVEGATVTIPRVGAAITDSLGVATLAGLVDGTYTVVVEAAGYYPGAAAGTVVALTTVDVSVALTALPDDSRAWLWGLTWDAAAVTPLSGVTVVTTGGSHPDNAQTATSDAAGLWLIADLHVGTEDVTASLTGYRDATASDVPLSAGAGTRLDLALVPTGTDVGALQGSIMDAADNSGVGQAEVWLDSIATAYSDDLGAYSFPVVAVGTHEAEALAAGFVPARVGNIPVADGVTTWLDIPLHRVVRLGTLTVTVVDGDGVPVEGATVLVAQGIEGVTDADGELTVDVPEAWYNVLAYADGYAPGTTLVETLAGETVTCTVTLTADATGSYLVGLVLDQWTGAGIRGATVTAGGYTATSALQGAYSSAVPAATYDVVGSADDYMDRTEPDVVVASREVTRCDLVLLPGSDPAGLDFVGVPAAATVPEGGPAAILVDYEDDGTAAWELAVTTDGTTRFRRGQRVPRGIETVLEQPGEDVRILGRRTSGQIGGVAASLRP